MEFNIQFYFCKFNVMHWSIILWDFTINHNKIRFRAQSEKLLCLISLLPFTRAVNMLSSKYDRAFVMYMSVCVLNTSCYLIPEQTAVGSMSTDYVRSLSDKAEHTLTMHEHLCEYRSLFFTTFQHGYLHAQWFLKEKSYIMTIKWSTFGWPASSASNKGVTDGDSLTDTHRPALWTCLWNLLLQMGTLKWTTRSTAPRNISRTNWDRRNPVGKTLPYSTALHSYQARLWFLSSFHSIPLSIHLSTSLCLSSLLFSFAGVRLMKTEARMIHQEDEEKEMKK